MKIAVISSGNIPSKWAHSINVVKHANGFRKLGHDVEILTVIRASEFINKLKIKDVQDYYDIDQTIPIKYFFDQSIFFFQKIKFFRRILKLINNFFSDLKDIWDPERKIAEYCKKKKFDLVYCRTYCTPIYTIKYKIPTIIETHTINVNKKDFQLLIKLSNEKYFKGIVTIHDNLKKKYVQVGVPREKILVLEDAVDFSKFEKIELSKEKLRKILGLPKNKKILMYAGSLKLGKGINEILKIAKYFQSDIQIYIIGGNNKEVKYWKKKTRSYGLNNVFFTGFVKNKFIPLYLKSADILLLLFDLHENKPIMDLDTTSPLKLFEYMATKIPIVSLKIPTIEKVIKHENDALLANINDTKDIVKCIKRLLSDTNLVKRLTNNAFEKVKQYTYTYRCKKIINYFNH